MAVLCVLGVLYTPMSVRDMQRNDFSKNTTDSPHQECRHNLISNCHQRNAIK